MTFTRSEHCVTRNHIEVWHERVLPSGPERIRFGTVLRGSLLPILVWTGVACFAYFVYNPVAAMVLGGLFALSFIVGLAAPQGKALDSMQRLRCAGRSARQVHGRVLMRCGGGGACRGGPPHKVWPRRPTRRGRRPRDPHESSTEDSWPSAGPGSYPRRSAVIRASRMGFGDPDIARAQLHQLLEASEQPTITLLVLPFGQTGFPASGQPITYAAA